ncbi:hypothetical protein B9479_004460 [Cryptococcus floricola]|uniref:Uncharacterized protein n=1 Tax=Cryptococcus floricola TaxID=2591691 RepID=A0A5D3AVU6_9TREE|nr:hypothetical protein B9479_004460 [Cryptococcus floricola]
MPPQLGDPAWLNDEHEGGGIACRQCPGRWKGLARRSTTKKHYKIHHNVVFDDAAVDRRKTWARGIEREYEVVIPEGEGPGLRRWLARVSVKRAIEYQYQVEREDYEKGSVYPLDTVLDLVEWWPPAATSEERPPEYRLSELPIYACVAWAVAELACEEGAGERMEEMNKLRRLIGPLAKAMRRGVRNDIIQALKPLRPRLHPDLLPPSIDITLDMVNYLSRQAIPAFADLARESTLRRFVWDLDLARGSIDWEALERVGEERGPWDEVRERERVVRRVRGDYILDWVQGAVDPEEKARWMRV